MNRLIRVIGGAALGMGLMFIGVFTVIGAAALIAATFDLSGNVPPLVRVLAFVAFIGAIAGGIAGFLEKPSED